MEGFVEKVSEGSGTAGVMHALREANNDLKSKNIELEKLTDEMQEKYRQMSETVNSLNDELNRVKVFVIIFFYDKLKIYRKSYNPNLTNWRKKVMISKTQKKRLIN